MALSKTDFDYVRELVHRHSAIVLEPGKEYLIEARLLALARKQGAASIESLVEQVRTSPLQEMRQKVVEALTTGETSFFRDLHPWEALRTTLVPELMHKRASDHRLVFWCLACSTGQEPYTLSMLLKEHFPALASWTVQLIAADISREALKRSAAGRYTQLEVNRGLPATMLVKYFERDGLEWQVKPELRRSIEFKELNLAGVWPALPARRGLHPQCAHLLRCANQEDDPGKIRQLMPRKDGYPFLGGAETTINLDDAFERLQISKATGCEASSRPDVEEGFMPIADSDISQVTEAIWGSVLGMLSERSDTPVIVDHGHQPLAHDTIGRHVTACVHITGTWQGAVVSTLAALARKTASMMFGIDGETPPIRRSATRWARS
ncbi:MAG: protein-glutamate O-methyltransferase CheR [Planctomycetota bacterium]